MTYFLLLLMIVIYLFLFRNWTICIVYIDRHYLVVPVEHISTVKDLQKREEDFALGNGNSGDDNELNY